MSDTQPTITAVTEEPGQDAQDAVVHQVAVQAAEVLGRKRGRRRQRGGPTVPEIPPTVGQAQEQEATSALPSFVDLSQNPAFAGITELQYRALQRWNAQTPLTNEGEIKGAWGALKDGNLLDQSAAKGPEQMLAGPSSPSLEVQDFTESTIRYGESHAEAAARLGVDIGELETRKPHTKRGTGSSGTDHKVADGRAANRATRILEDKIEDKTGVRMSTQRFVTEKAKEEKTKLAREERQAGEREKAQAKIEKDSQEFRRWIAFLAPQRWWDQQESWGNDVRKPRDKDRSRLERTALSEGWPLEWKDEYSGYIYDV